MAGQQGVRCAAQMLLHICLITAAAGLQQPVNPRGWQAARQAEQRSAAAAAAGWAQLQGVQPEGLPAGAYQAYQQTCGFTQPPVFPAPRAAGWPQLLVAFLCGVLASALLQYWLQLHRTRRQGPAAAGAGPGEVQHNHAPQQQKPEDQRAEAARLEPAGSEAGQAPPQAPAASSAGARPAVEAAGSAAGAAILVGAAAGAVVGLEEVGESSAAGQSSAVVAVQELVMQQSSGASGAGSSGSQGSSAAEAPGLPSGHGGPEEQQVQQQPAELVDGSAGAVDGSLGLTKEQADIQAAGELVMSMCAALHIHPAQLLPGERLQLIHTTLHVWQAQQAQRAAEEIRRLASEANTLRGQQVDIAERREQLLRKKEERKLSLERTADFRRMCSDTLTFGLLVMAVAGTYQLFSRGLLASVTASCGSVGAALEGRRWGLWAAYRAGEAVACHALSVGDALLGLGMLLAAPWLAFRSGLLSDFHIMPVTKLFVGLGLICGLPGYLAVGKLGGNRNVWLAAWEAWVTLHIAFSTAAYRLKGISSKASSRQCTAGAARMHENSSGWLEAAMWVLLGLALPVLAGTLPFRW